MDDLMQWLGEQLDEDERIARAAAEPEKWIELNRAPHLHWSVEYWADPDRAAVVAEESSAYPVVVTAEGMDEADAEARAVHVAEHDPARVLLETDAKRQLIRELLDYEAQFDSDRGCGHSAEYFTSGLHSGHMPKDILGLRLMASGYSHRPGFREEWRP
jgi:hypothetical protein